MSILFFLAVSVKSNATDTIMMIRPMTMTRAGIVARVGKMRNTSSLVGKPERKRPLGIIRCRWENNIKMDRREIGCWNVDWNYLAQKGPSSRVF
jgi:hypothetical protein